MAKNIIICFDGTSNEFGRVNTNVVRLFQCLDRTPTSGQVAFYDPGVGTLSSPTFRTNVGKWWSKQMGLAFGAGIMDNVEDALGFLALQYSPGDRVYIFGFSRGAFTARILAGYLHKCGLREAGASNLDAYFTSLYLHGKDQEVNNAFKVTFGRPCPVHFLGVWDTVSSVGWAYNPKHFQYTQNNPEVEHARHAVALDERRCFFRTNLLGNARDKKELWFAGSHCDVGGGYPENGPSLWKVSFKWMTDEARSFGLIFHENKAREILSSENETEESWVLAPKHESLQGMWLLAEMVPKRYWNYRRTSPSYQWRFPKTQSRFIPNGSILHHSVIQRLKKDLSYRPPNIENSFVETVLQSKDEIADTVYSI